jgi:hypothetical protein
MIWWPHMSNTLIFWGAIVLIVFAGSFFRYRENASRDRTIQTLAEKGQPIPPELLGRHYYRDRGWEGGYYRRNRVSHGIFLMCIGIALAIFLGAPDWNFDSGDFHLRGIAWVGIFPFMIGFAYLLGSLFDRAPPPPKP